MRLGGEHLIYGIGHSSDKYPATINGVKTKEYEAWYGLLRRCRSEKYLSREPAYSGCIVSNEWLYYDNFYNWIVFQDNYDKWKDGSHWGIDKDILLKGNKIYSDKTCLLVPQNVNGLFTNRRLHRGDCPIGVDYLKKLDKFRASCMNPFTKKQEHIGVYCTQEEAFVAYKAYKESIIQKVAKEEYQKGNITDRCYNAMLNYQIEIND